ncbi:tRNA (cmo5U34)-methyltransferase [hydrothermal vent metagenome]|uniref:tRNA (Cmo5U34)-methyltransferase n=1 Tax=hydrothermal vent metagenome TaxID=652676 RepID=A0A3B0YI49_9ZZZZ
MKSTRKSHNMSSEKTDQLYSQPRESITDFVFDDAVVAVFDDMIGRSVPGYRTLLSMFAVLAREFVTPQSVCYDLGCSLGAATLAIQQGITARNVSIIAVDNAPAMIEKCRLMTQQLRPNGESGDAQGVRVDVVQADLCETPIDNASLVVMNFTLQFIDENMRQQQIEKIFSGLNQGGVFILSEKICSPDMREQNSLTLLHHAFKKANGYSELEISQKRTALEKVLVPETVEQHITRLRQAGFSQVMVWFQCFNFVSFLAIK